MNLAGREHKLRQAVQAVDDLIMRAEVVWRRFLMGRRYSSTLKNGRWVNGGVVSASGTPAAQNGARPDVALLAPRVALIPGAPREIRIRPRLM